MTHRFPRPGGVAVFASAAWLAALAGCGAPEPVARPFMPPPALLVESYHFGTALSGPRPGDPSGLTAADSFGLQLTLFALEAFNPDALEPLATRSTMVVASGAERPVQATERLSRGVRIGNVERFDAVLEALAASSLERAACVAKAVGALPPGVTFGARVLLRAKTPRTPGPEAFQVQAFRLASGDEAKSIRVAFVREGSFVPEAEETPKEPSAEGKTPPAPPPEPPMAIRELSLIEGELRDVGDSLAGVIPIAALSARDGPSADVPVAAYAFVLEVTAGPGGALPPETFGRCAAALAAVATAELKLADIESEIRSGGLRLQRTASAIADRATRRRALLYIAAETGARLTEDLALSTSNELLARIAERILESIQALKGPMEMETIGWAFEEATLRTVGGLLDEEKRPPELEGLLALHLGQAGRQSAAIERVLAGSRSLRDMEARLIEENFTFLEDSSPQARSRAVEWLAARGRAPAGYDPLASARERRVALEKAAEKAAADQAAAQQAAAQGATADKPAPEKAAGETTGGEKAPGEKTSAPAQGGKS